MISLFIIFVINEDIKLFEFKFRWERTSRNTSISLKKLIFASKQYFAMYPKTACWFVHKMKPVELCIKKRVISSRIVRFPLLICDFEYRSSFSCWKREVKSTCDVHRLSNKTSMNKEIISKRASWQFHAKTQKISFFFSSPYNARYRS